MEHHGHHADTLPGVGSLAGFDALPLLDSQAGLRGELLQRPAIPEAGIPDVLAEEPGAYLRVGG